MTTAYPLAWPAGWPRAKPIGAKGMGPFSCTPAKAINDLYGELHRLGASHVVVSSNCKVNLRGIPYAEDLSARLPDPGVAVYFQFRARPMTMAQDVYQVPWANIRSLGLAIAALRAIERHGGGYMMQRSFDGFAQLPPPEGSHGAVLRPWREVLEMGDPAYASIPADGQIAIAETRYRDRARKAHPDSGGSADTMAELNIAIQQARGELS